MKGASSGARVLWFSFGTTAPWYSGLAVFFWDSDTWVQVVRFLVVPPGLLCVPGLAVFFWDRDTWPVTSPYFVHMAAHQDPKMKQSESLELERGCAACARRVAPSLGCRRRAGVHESGLLLSPSCARERVLWVHSFAGFCHQACALEGSQFAVFLASPQCTRKP